jgi:hypothetical protein
MKKKKRLPLLADWKQKEKQQTLSFLVCSFVVSNRMKKNVFPLFYLKQINSNRHFPQAFVLLLI